MLEAFESDSDKTEMIFLEHIQAWILLAMFEFMHNNHQRGLMSAGRAFRLVQMLCLFEIDSPSYAMARQSCAPTDHVKPEESRRTFWVAYTMDRVVSFNYGLPLTLNELEICTRLPTPEAKFQSGEPALMGFLCEVMGGINQDSVPPFTECIILATICGRSVSHKQRMTVEGVYGASTQDSLDRHQWLNTILAARIQVLSLSCPSTSESVDPILIFANLLAQATVLYLYKIIEPVVLEKDENQGMMAQYEQQSLTAAEETSHLTKMLAQLNHFQVNPSPPVQRFFGLQPLTFGWQAHPFVPVCLFVCAEFFMKHRSVNRSYGLQLQETLEALRRLASFNNLARVYLHLLGLNDA
ncbi:hypothetical protein HO133_000921 [Letharia lupina]|uniref:Xylanolytic transcriptional activator regulatory domain-containing protein n=1 Tax=Letharia lupina TaxID=560253 RepID=A0A8H6CFZ4_9LECA|nr:uncharacterized protein HO133_000921 [Letharia lupina]KAF6222870.1 hypothetical protein HO133_000921 [Letharia lupina]